MSKCRYRKETVLKMADMLEYTLIQNRSAIYLIKGEDKIYRKSFANAYSFLYVKKKEIGLII